MKNLKLYLALFSLFFYQHGFSQFGYFGAPTGTKTISVSGSAEIEIQADEIEIEITLQSNDDEYEKTSFTEIESQLYHALQKNKIDTSALKFNYSREHWYRWWQYRNKYTNQKRFRLRLKKMNEFHPND